MIPRRRLAYGLALAAAILFFGRALALIYAEYAWYNALGAVALWRERTYDLFAIHTVSAVFGGLFALVNLSAIRRSIISLAFPRRLGNVEFGEEVPRRILDGAAFVLSAAVAIVMAFMVPRWERLAMLRLRTTFGESDPFYQMDLGFFTSWIPLERAVYVWCLTLLVVVSALVAGLYALTPSLKWHGGAFHVSARARRHLSILAALFLVTMAWSYRLDGYALLMHGSGPEGMFSHVDHQWLIPAYLSLSIGTLAAAALVLLSGWTGRMRAGFFTISAVLIFSITLDLVLPGVVRRLAGGGAANSRERPYVATRAAFTARAYGVPREADRTARFGNAPFSPPAAPQEVRRFSTFADSARVARAVTAAGDSVLVYPGASGAALVGRGHGIAAPRLGHGITRLAHAWSEQRLDLAWSDRPADTRVARRRDVRERIGALMPLYAQGNHIAPVYVGDTLVWLLELYSASDSYPLARRYTLAGEERSYFRHSGTALVNSMTGRLTVVPALGPDPIAMAWRARFPANIRAGNRDLLDAVTAAPTSSGGFPTPAIIPATDSAYHSEVTRLYSRMRGALSAGDLAGFAAAYDSLGAVIGLPLR